MKDILPFMTTQVGVDGIMLREISQRKKNKYYDFTDNMESKSKIWTGKENIKRKRVTDTESKMVVARRQGFKGVREMGEGVKGWKL